MVFVRLFVSWSLQIECETRERLRWLSEKKAMKKLICLRLTKLWFWNIFFFSELILKYVHISTISMTAWEINRWSLREETDCNGIENSSQKFKVLGIHSNSQDQTTNSLKSTILRVLRISHFNWEYLYV